MYTKIRFFALCLLLAFSLSGCSPFQADSSFLGRKLSRFTGQEAVITLPNTVQKILWVDFTAGGLLGSTIKNVTFIDIQGEYYTLEVKDYEAFQGLIHWLKPGSKENESWTTSRTYTSKWGGVTKIKLPEDFAELLSVSIKADGIKDVTYKSTTGELKSREYKDFNPFESTIVWSTTEEDRVTQFLFGRSFSRFTGKPVKIKLPDNFERLIGVDFTEFQDQTIKNITYVSKDGKYYTLENKDKGIFEGGVEWTLDGKSNTGLNTRMFSRFGFEPATIHLPKDAREIISVSVKANGVKDVVYVTGEGKIKAREYRDLGLLEGELRFEIKS
jgi:hypothetical protein